MQYFIDVSFAWQVLSWHRLPALQCCEEHWQVWRAGVRRFQVGRYKCPVHLHDEGHSSGLCSAPICLACNLLLWCHTLEVYTLPQILLQEYSLSTFESLIAWQMARPCMWIALWPLPWIWMMPESDAHLLFPSASLDTSVARMISMCLSTWLHPSSAG